MTDGMTELTLDVVGSALFGRGMADLAKRIGPTVTGALRAAERATRLMVVANPPLPLVRAAAGAVRHVPLPPPLGYLHNVMKTIDDTVWGVIHDRQAVRRARRRPARPAALGPRRGRQAAAAEARPRRGGDVHARRPRDDGERALVDVVPARR